MGIFLYKQKEHAIKLKYSFQNRHMHPPLCSEWPLTH